MIKEAISILTNWRFWSFYIIGFLPMWGCLIAVAYLKIKEKIYEVLQRR